MRKKLSIVTVVYNGERFIENAINSVISQKNEQVEYIIVDGGSTDSTLNIIEKYKNKIDIF
ncbi:glycosyltransferase, partial [Escherichia coli]|nr:glycosyltransferase [Escherichia coli]